MADEIFLDNLNSEVSEGAKFISSEWAYFGDNNMGHYESHNVTFDTSNIIGGDTFFLWSEAILVLPTVSQIMIAKKTTNVGCTLTEVDYAMIPKSGSHNWVHQLTATVDGKTLPTTYLFQNEISNARLLMETSSDGLTKNGSLRNFYPDTANSWKYKVAPTDGNVKGYSNNRIQNSTASTGYDALFNAPAINGGLQKRGNYVCDGATNPNTIAITGTIASAIQVCKNVAYFDNTGSTAMYLINDVCIPLKDISSFHKALDFPVKALSQQLVFQINDGVSTCIQHQTASTAVIAYVVPLTSTHLGTCPIMITDAFLTKAASYKVAATVDVVSEWNIVMTNSVGTKLTTPSGATISPHLAQCRIYVPYVKFSPTWYPKSDKKIIKFSNYTYYGNAVNQGGATNPNININIASLIPNLKRVFMFCYVSDKNADQVVSTLLSPFADGNPTATWFTQEVLSINNIPFSRTPNNYLFETFIKELRTASLNGGIDDSLCSGLLNSNDHASLYSGLKVWDVSRNPAVMSASSVQVSYAATMQTLLPVDFHFFLESEKACEINLQTGSVISANL